MANPIVSNTPAASWVRHPTISGIMVSSTGDVARLSDGRVYAKTKDKDGYLQVSFWCCGARLTKKIHRLVAESFIGDVRGLDVNHLNGVKGDNRASNLEICTKSQNHIHARNTLGVLIGEGNGASKLTRADVVEIRRLRAGGATSRELAARFGVQRRNIDRVVDRTRWDSVP